MSNTSRDGGSRSDYGALNYNKEEKKEIVRDFTQSILFQSGSTGGNKNLFVDSKQAFTQLPIKNNSPNMSGMSTSKTGFFAQSDPYATDYKSLKKHERASRVFDKQNGRSSSIAIMRIERELSP